MIDAAIVQMAPETVPAGVVARAEGKEASGESLFSELLGAAALKIESGATDQPKTDQQSASDVFSLLLANGTDAASAIAALIGQPIQNANQPAVEPVPVDAASPVLDPLTGSVQAWVAPEIAIQDGPAIPSDAFVMPNQTDPAEKTVAETPQVGQTSPLVRDATVETTEQLVAATNPQAEPVEGQPARMVAGKEQVQTKPDMPDQQAPVVSDVPKPAESSDKPSRQLRAESKPMAETPVMAQQPAQEPRQVQSETTVTSNSVLAAKVETGKVVMPAESSDGTPTDTGASKDGGDHFDLAALLNRTEQAHRSSTGAASRVEHAETPAANIDRRIIDQVVRAVTLHKGDGRTDMVVRLNPPDLGTLTVQMTQDASGVTSQIQTSSDQVRGLLQAHMPALMDALSEAGVKVNSVQVTSSPSFNTLMHNSAQESGYQHQQGNAPQRRYPGADGAMTMTIDPAAMAASSYESAGYSWLA